MAAHVLTFKVEMNNTDGQVFRVFEISDQRTVLEMMCTALAAFEMNISHFMKIHVRDLDYGLTEEVEEDDSLEDADRIKLCRLQIHPTEELTLLYDYQENWLFKLMLIDSTEMQDRTGSRYPRVIDGAGPGIREAGRGLYEVAYRFRLQGEDRNREFDAVSDILKKFPVIPEFKLKRVNAQLKRNTRNAVKDYRDRVIVLRPKPFEMTFRIFLKGYGRRLWQKIMISSNATLDDLVQIILMNVKPEGDHLYDLEFDGYKYGIPSADNSEPLHDSRQVYLFDMALKKGEQIVLNYNYDGEWRFTISYWGDGQVISDPSEYPKIIGGRG